MKKVLIAILIIVSVLSLCACGGTEAAEPTPEPLKFSENPTEIAEASESVVMLTCYDSKGEPVCTGSAFQCFEEGIYVTNYHVVEGVTSIKANTESELYFDINEIVALSEEKDIAILKTTARPGVAVLVDGDSDELIKGENVVAIGSPQGFLNTVSKGTYSGALTVDNRNYIQFSAAISAGSSGGALFNDNGEVVGITSASYSEGQNLNFAVPINEVKNIWEHKESYAIPEKSEFVAYSPAYVMSHYDYFTSNSDFYVIGYIDKVRFVVDDTDGEYHFISNSLSKNDLRRGFYLHFDNFEEETKSISNKYIQKVLIHCNGIGGCTVDGRKTYAVDSIEATDLEPNNGCTDSHPIKENKEWQTVEEYYQNLENNIKLGCKVGGYISSKYMYRYKGSNGTGTFASFYMYLVDSESDVLGIYYERPSTDPTHEYETPIGPELIRKQYEESLEVHISYDMFGTVNCGDFIIITIPPNSDERTCSEFEIK